MTERAGNSLPVPSFAFAPASDPEGRRHWLLVGAGSIAAHLLIFLAVAGLAQLPSSPPVLLREIDLEARPRNVTKLIAPPDVLTQKAPNKGKVSEEFDLSSLPPRPEQANVPASPGAQALPKRAFKLPDKRTTPAAKPALTEAPTAPAIDLAQMRTNAPPPALGQPVPVPPPPVEPREKPRLAFERPGTNTGSPTLGVGQAAIQRPITSVEEAARQVARGAGKGLIVGDEDASPGASPASPSVPIPGKLGSAVELLSDPQGVDFWPYLVKVLTTVRRNWFAVIPESARFGRQGKAVIQFAINRDGSVPKLVIATPSGAEALDRAAVAGISASNPFLPLPPEFKGNQIRLQFVFKYNVK